MLTKWAVCQLNQLLRPAKKKGGGDGESCLKTQFCVINSEKMQAGYGWIVEVLGDEKA